MQHSNIFKRLVADSMHIKIIIPVLFIFFLHSKIYSQGCTELGQNPGTAYPVCGTSSFTQTTVPICGHTSVPTPCRDGADYQDKNPYWYKFTCFTSGTLAFVITPNNLADDYDWQLFDVTGHNVTDVYSDPSLFVACNWSGLSGLTGASNSGTGLINCAGPAFPLFSKMPSLIQGHDYLLLISHFSDSQSGYQLSFGGGSANITDTTKPKLLKASISCDAKKITVKLNKKMKCNSLAADGSDFVISSGGVVSSVVGNGCSTGFDVDSITIFLSSLLAPGNYTISAATGTDGNTLLDNCAVSLPVGSSAGFTVTGLQPTPMDSISAVKCSPTTLHLEFKKPILCSSIAADGSDFNVTGPALVNVISANGTCNSNGVSSSIDMQLGAPIQLGGTFQIHLKNGSDGNTLIDECGQQTPPSTLSFVTSDTVSASFTFQTQQGCRFDTISFSHDGRNGVNSWKWKLNGSLISNQQNFRKPFAASGQYPIQLLVSNGVCTDSVTTTIVLNNQVKASFETNSIICPEDSAIFKNTSTGTIDAWLWNFGNSNTSTQQNPAFQKYPVTGTDNYYSVLLTVFNNNLGCKDTTTQKIRVLKSCYIAVPNAFTPNDDGLNDFLYPLNAFKADNLNFSVYNRWGKLVFKTTDWTKKWNGKIKGEPQPSGIYVWTLNYTHHDTGQKFSLKGTALLIR